MFLPQPANFFISQKCTVHLADHTSGNAKQFPPWWQYRWFTLMKGVCHLQRQEERSRLLNSEEFVKKKLVFSPAESTNTREEDDKVGRMFRCFYWMNHRLSNIQWAGWNSVSMRLYKIFCESMKVLKYAYTRSLGALRAPTWAGFGPFGGIPWASRRRRRTGLRVF